MFPCTLLTLLFLAADPTEARQGGNLQSSRDQRLTFAKQAAAGYQFRLPDAASHKVIVQPEPLLRWDNHVVREDDGMLFLWTDGEKGRPIAGAQFFLVDTVWHHEFQSLAAEPIAARDQRGNWNWGPTREGVRWQVAEELSAPGDSATQRLRQMKQFVGQFTAAVDQNAGFDAPEQLRLLTTPLYRYSSSDAEIIDGAMFGFVQGTNPEILVMIEATNRSPTKAAWRYGFARMSCFYLQVYRDGKIIWSQQRAPVPTPDRASPYYFRLSAQTDASAEVVVRPQPGSARP
ncbi:MAG TPA: hypothetical protein VFI31_16970 [Pirellulales bacterium]|nr:hypothetical protein [Pirellulales bacterium]